jgi:hypothetical protein
MRKITGITITVLFLTIFFSCVTSLHPVTTYKNIITEKRIEGTWNYKDMKLLIEKIPDTILHRIVGGWAGNKIQRYNDSVLFYNSYEVDVIKNGVGYQFNLDLTRINHNIYIDIGPAGFDPPIDKGMWQKKYGKKLEYLPTYTMARLEIPNDSILIIHFFDGSFVRNLVAQDKMKIKHEEDKLYDMFLITASSEELQQFISKYGENERLYDEKNRVILKRNARL